MADSHFTLETERLLLAPVRPQDVDELHALFLEPEVRRYMLDGKEMGRDWVEELVVDSDKGFGQRNLGLFAVRGRESGAQRESDAQRESGALVGLTGYAEFYDPPVLEILWALQPSFFGRGLATEMASTAIHHGFTTGGLDQIRASTDLPNEASVRVMERLGMRFVGREPGEIWEQVHYVLEPSDWQP